MLFGLPMAVDFAGAQPGTIAYYSVVDYPTLKRRSKQLYEFRGENEWEFNAALVLVESGMSYKAYNSSGAAGLYGMKKVACEYLRISYDDMRKSVPIQLRAGKKLMADYRKRIASAAPEVLARGGEDLYAVTYLYHNLGIGAAPNIIKKVRAKGKEVTWTNIKPFVTGRMVEVINKLIALVPQFRDRYAELVLDQTTRVATFSETGEGSEGALEAASAELEQDLMQAKPEDDGEDLPIPAALDDYGPEPLPDGSTVTDQTHAGASWGMRLLVGGLAAAALAGGTYVLIQSSRGKRVFA